MRIAISGATGLIGKTLKDHFLKNGHEVNEISRHRKLFNNKHTILLDLNKNYVDAHALEGHDIIIHLAGANISSKRWSKAYKKEILESRVKSTRILVHAIKDMNRRPKIFLCASAVGYYGNHDPAVPIDERNGGGHGFLAQVCQEWENASAEAILYGVRLIHMRFGVVLSKKGGALTKMLPVFYFGLGGRLGSGRQPMSWIMLDEIPNIVEHFILNEQISGPVNIVAPNAVTNREFTKALGKAIHRPAFLPVPGFMIKLLMGQMGKELLLEGAKVYPRVLINSGYTFKHPTIEEALKRVN